MKKIIQLCADTGSDTKPYRDNGYEVILIGSKIGVENYHPPKDVYGIIANPLYEYQPWWYGSPWTKKTALWGKFNLPKRIFQKWEDVPKNPNLWVRKRNRVKQNNRYTGKPEMHTLHKSAVKHIQEFSCFNPESDMEFRSLCSQKFAQAFFEVNN